MEKNKVTTYLLYAVGEIVLVVIGILIAVSINNSNQERKLQASKLDLLESLSEDFEITSDRTIEAKNFIQNNITRVERFLELSSGSMVVPVDTLKSLANGSFRGLNFYPALSSYEAAVSTGQIRLSEGKDQFELVNQFYKHYRFLEDHHEFAGWDFYYGGFFELRKQLGNLTSIGSFRNV